MTAKTPAMGLPDQDLDAVVHTVMGHQEIGAQQPVQVAARGLVRQVRQDADTALIPRRIGLESVFDPAQVRPFAESLDTKRRRILDGGAAGDEQITHVRLGP